MSSKTGAAALLRPDALRPYAKAVVLEYVGSQEMTDALSDLVQTLRRMHRSSSSRAISIVAEGFEQGPVHLPEPLVLPDEGSEVEHGAAQALVEDDFRSEDSLATAFVASIQKSPSWATESAGLVEIEYSLTVVCWWSRLVAIHADGSLVDKIQTWLDGRMSPPFRRVPASVINATLLTGEAKSLWLRGAHSRRSTKADTKNVAGSRLQDSLNPLDDSTFAMGSARAEVVQLHPDLRDLTGVIGTTPRKSLVWMAQTTEFVDFLAKIRDLLRALRRSLDSGLRVERPYPWLATEQHSLSGVSGAYEVVPVAMEHLEPGADPDLEKAAGLLFGSSLHIAQVASGPDFVMEVGPDNTTCGKVACVVTVDRGRVNLSFGPSGNGTDPTGVSQVLRILRAYPELVSVYYESGHVIHSGAVWSANMRPAPFPNWDWREFSGYRIDREKPISGSPQTIHDAIAAGGDTSLFSWVVEKYATQGWLTCDDGSGEVADFVHVWPDRTLELIHVKGAASRAPARGISVSAYEVVVGQATKNLVYLDGDMLAEHLALPMTYKPACWTAGVRVADRQDLIAQLGSRTARDALRVTVVQPHVLRSRYAAVPAASATDPNRPRTALLETMLNSARASATGLVADLFVIADGR